MSVDNEDLYPDPTILSIIFPDDPCPAVTILSQTGIVCTFRARHNNTDDVVRLEVPFDSGISRLHTISAIQSVAALAIPNLIPEIKRIGTGQTGKGQKLNFSVIAFVPDAVTLEEVWEDLDDDQKSTIMDEIIDSMTKLRSLRPDDERVKHLLASTDFSTPNSTLGSPELGYFTDIPCFLRHIVQLLSLERDIVSDCSDGGIMIKSAVQGDIHEVHLSQQVLEDLSKHICLCHNDIEPRNFLVRTQACPSGGVDYCLAALVDWEMAGFLPSAYEVVSKHHFLGAENLILSWYLLFFAKSHAESEEEQLICALNLLYRTAEEQTATSRKVGIQFRQKWLVREGLLRDKDLTAGWKRKDSLQGTPMKFSKEENDELEMQVLKELGFI